MHKLPNDPAPPREYNPSKLVADVMAVLGQHGIEVIVDGNNATVATTAAADLLRSLGVDPVNLPHIPSVDHGYLSGSMGADEVTS